MTTPDQPGETRAAPLQSHLPAIPFHVVQALVGSLLIGAALLKGHQLLTQPTASPLWHESRIVQTGFASAELLVAVWIIATQRQRLARHFGLLLFGVFLIVSLVRLSSGATSCGCFGRLEVHPLWTVLLDTVCLVVLALAKPTGPPASSPKSSREFMAPTLALAGVVAPFVFFALQPVGTSLVAHGLTVQRGELVLLEPATWIGKRCPILDHIETNESLDLGKTLLVLVRHDCHTCEERIPEYLKLAQSGTVRVALVEVPPVGQNLEQIVSGRLREDIDWFVQTPAEMVLEDGVVRHASQGNSALEQLVPSVPHPGETDS